VRTTTVPYRLWPLRARILERLYRWTHGGQIRTLVVETLDIDGGSRS
jgi:hypothetical protein